jgi:hypothetical protein
VLQDVQIQKFFRLGRLASRLVLSAVFLGGVILFSATFTKTVEIWLSRNIFLSEMEWPRRSQLVVEGFNEGRTRIGRGDSFTLTVRASTAMPLIPETIRLRLGSQETGYRTVLLDQFRIDSLNGTEWRTFSYNFVELLETVTIQVRGEDSTINDLIVEVVPPPALTETKLQQKFPEYMNRSERTISLSGRITIPDGTNLIVTGKSNKPLVKAEAVLDRQNPILLQKGSAEKPFDSLLFSMDKIRHDTLLEFQLEDIDLLRNRQPIRLHLGIIKDQPPTVTARLDGIGAAITSNAILPTSGEITDDYGLAAATYRFEIERGKAEEAQKEETGKNVTEKTEGEKTETDPQPESPQNHGMVTITQNDSPQTIFPLSETFSVSKTNVQPGDKLSLFVEATDRFNLDEVTGQTGLGPRWTLEIVTPERLQSLLEVREISLRQRFEVLIGEVERTKMLMEEFSLVAPPELVQEADSQTNSMESLTDVEDENKMREELEAKKQKIIETISKEQAASGQYNISRSLRDTQKEVYDLRTIIESFLLIRREMVNNRIFSDDAEQRFDFGIIRPMQELVDVDFPEIDRFIGLLNQMLEVRDQPLRSAAISQQKKISEQFILAIKKMTAIRDKMVSMESFNEAIEILRAIIQQQQQLRNETQEEKNKRLKNLLK